MVLLRLIWFEYLTCLSGPPSTQVALPLQPSCHGLVNLIMYTREYSTSLGYLGSEAFAQTQKSWQSMQKNVTLNLSRAVIAWSKSSNLQIAKTNHIFTSYVSKLFSFACINQEQIHQTKKLRNHQSKLWVKDTSPAGLFQVFMIWSGTYYCSTTFIWFPAFKSEMSNWSGSANNASQCQQSEILARRRRIWLLLFKW